MSRSTWMTVVGLAAASVLLAVWFARAERGAPELAGASEPAPVVEAAPSELRAAPAVPESESAELPRSRESVPAGDTRVADPAAGPLAELAVTVRFPPGVDPPVPWRDVIVALSPAQFERMSQSSPGRIASASPHADGTLALARVPTDVALDLVVERPHAAEWRQHLEPFARGERREVLVTLEAGITISGRLVDEDDAPIEGVRVRARAPRTQVRGTSDPESEQTSTDASGNFRFVDLSRHDWVIETILDIRNSAEASVAGSAGDASGLVLRVKREKVIEGTVTWADGRPVEEGVLRAIGRFVPYDEESFSGGGFRLTMSPGTYGIAVRASANGVLGVARVAGVVPGDEPLHLVLEESRAFELRGEVVDAEGASIPTFVLDVKGPGFDSHEFHDEASFQLDLPAGDFTVRVESLGFVGAEKQVTLGPGLDAPLRFALARTGLVRGRVVDASGAPVEGARLLDRSMRCTTSAADGTFAFQAIGAHVSLVAAKKGYVSSAPLELEVASGAVTEDVVLRLLEGGAIRGRVFDPEGRGAGGISVSAARTSDAQGKPSWQALATVESDSDGRFALEDLPPGTLHVSASSRSDAPSFVHADVVVVAHATADVELRFATMRAVWLGGAIHRSGNPMACRLLLRCGETTVPGLTLPDGSVRIPLPRTGTWKGFVCPRDQSLSSADSDRRTFTIDVKSEGSYELALDFDTLPHADPNDVPR